MIQLYKGDCLLESGKIETGSVDLILTDLPFGTIKGLELDGYSKETTYWDEVINTDAIMALANRILRKNGKLVLFAQHPFTKELLDKALPNLPFCYSMIWEKDHFANALSAKKAPVNYFEDILVFSKKNPVHDCEFTHPLRSYFEQVHKFIGGSKKAIIEKIGQRADHVFRYNSSQFSLCTSEVYEALILEFGIFKMQGFREFKDLEEEDRPFKSNPNQSLNLAFPSTFNLWEGKKFKSNILKYKKDYDGYHPTQKPVLLLEDIIKTFSNVNDTVVDLTMGSGSTGVACENTYRNFIGIEQDEKYFNIATKRIDEAGEINSIL